MTISAALRLARRAVRYELKLWRSLYRWVFRRPVTREPGAATFGYASAVTPVFGAFIGLSAVEIPIMHLLLPWEDVRTVTLALGAYGVFWMVGLLASIRVHPHVVGDAGLRVRTGLSVDVAIPWDAIAEIRARPRAMTPGRNVRRQQGRSGPVLLLGVAHQTSIDVLLRDALAFPLPKGATEPVTELRFHADDPDALVARAREYLTADQKHRRAGA